MRIPDLHQIPSVCFSNLPLAFFKVLEKPGPNLSSTQELQRQTQSLMRRSLDLEEELEDLELKHQAAVMAGDGW